MGLTQRIQGTNVPKYAITPNEVPLFTLDEMKQKIQNGVLQRETLVFCTEVDKAPPSSGIKKWKEAYLHHELKTIFDDLPPPPPTGMTVN